MLVLIIFIINIFINILFFPSSIIAQSCPAAIPGDANNDCIVDGKDYLIWVNNYNKDTQSGSSEGDFDNNGIVDGKDYIIWRLNYQKTGSEFPTPTSVPDHKSTPTPESAQALCPLLFKKNSPWNTPIGANPKTHPKSQQIISQLTGKLAIDPINSGPPVYKVNSKTKKKKVKYDHDFRYFDDDHDDADDRDEKRLNIKNGSGRLDLPFPDSALPSNNGQLIILNSDTNEEWNLTGVRKNNGEWEADEIFKYITRHSGFAPGKFSRESGTPLLAGLVRGCEIRQGNIAHALAFSYPHIKINNESFTIPRGTRLQLNPAASEEEIRSWCGFNKVCRIFTTAMQIYGMYPVDHTDTPSVYVENNKTAHWDDILNNSLLKNIPLSAFKIVNPG